MTFVKALLRPPMRLRALPDRLAKLLRALWILLFGLSVLTVVVSAIYAVRASYGIQPTIYQFNLDFDVTTEGKLVVGTLPGRQPALPVKAKVIAIDGKPVPPNLQVQGFAERLDSAPGPTVAVTLRDPGGRTHVLTQGRSKITASPGEIRERDLRIWARLLTGLLACTALLACSLLLALRRPNDPVAMPLAYFVSIPDIDEDVQGILAVVVLLAVLGSQFVRFRREPAGIARQQIKWAGFGFAAGFLLILGAVVLAAMMGDDPSKYTPLMSLAVLLLFSSGMAAIAIGLLVALLRFRLWEADTVITRSAAYAVVTLIVGVVWAASSDLVKLVITEVMGRESEAGATTVGAIIAAGVFSPTQSAVLGWTRRHFGGPLDQIRDSAKRLKSWGLTEAPEEVATRALSIIDQAVHPNASAIVLDTAMGHELIAAREVTSAEDPKLIEKLTLEDEESSVGTLLIGRRSDGNRYNRQELEAIREIIPSLAEALRVARGRFSRESAMQQRMEEMAARLAQLEGGAPKPA